jgi:hypothetical protein
MRKHWRWLMFPLASGLVLLIGVRGGQADDPKRLTADDVIELWKPLPDGAKDFQQFVAAPKGNSGMMAATFRVAGPSFERLWNHYADLCGIRERFEEKHLWVIGGTSAKGSYVVSDRASSVGKGERGLSVFLLRTDRYTVTATIQPDADGKAMRGSIVAVTPGLEPR